MILTNIRRLIGNEDKLHLHKSLGVASLLHFGYRTYMFVSSGSMGFSGDATTVACIMLHMALSGTSLIFHLPNNRIRKAPMIWPEFRVHSILFAYRSLICMLLYWANIRIFPHTLTDHTYWLRCATLIGTLVAADYATTHFKALERGDAGTTMRSMPFPDSVTQKQRDMINMYYSVCQVFATLNIIASPGMERPFGILFPIQIAAFLMTLVRKSVISAGEWHIGYASALGINFVHAIFESPEHHHQTIPAPLYLATIVSFCTLRFRCRVNKYALWCGICVLLCK